MLSTAAMVSITALFAHVALDFGHLGIHQIAVEEVSECPNARWQARVYSFLDPDRKCRRRAVR